MTNLKVKSSSSCELEESTGTDIDPTYPTTPATNCVVVMLSLLNVHVSYPFILHIFLFSHRDFAPPPKKWKGQKKQKMGMFISVKWKKRCVETGNISLFTFLQGLQLSSLWLLVKQNKNIEKIKCNGKDRWKKQWNFIGVLRHWLRDKEIFTGDILILMKITGWSFISHQAPPPSPSSLQELRLGMRCVAWHQQKRARNEKNWERPRKKSLKIKKVISIFILSWAKDALC